MEPETPDHKPIIIRHYRVEQMDNPRLIAEITALYADTLVHMISTGDTFVTTALDGAIEVYACPTPLHSIAMIALVHAFADDDARAAAALPATPEE